MFGPTNAYGRRLRPNFYRLLLSHNMGSMPPTRVWFDEIQFGMYFVHLCMWIHAVVEAAIQKHVPHHQSDACQSSWMATICPLFSAFSTNVYISGSHSFTREACYRSWILGQKIHYDKLGAAVSSTSPSSVAQTHLRYWTKSWNTLHSDSS